tara:strand:- start:21780 stop:22232 length:453 start_codon:yes stop_codon:yes gene_type:complete
MKSQIKVNMLFWRLIFIPLLGCLLAGLYYQEHIITVLACIGFVFYGLGVWNQLNLSGQRQKRLVDEQNKCMALKKKISALTKEVCALHTPKLFFDNIEPNFFDNVSASSDSRFLRKQYNKLFDLNNKLNDLEVRKNALNDRPKQGRRNAS